MFNEIDNLFGLIGIGFAIAIGFRGFDELLRLIDSFLQRHWENKSSQ